MPIKNYYGGKGRSVMGKMTKRYGKKGGKRVFYATVNKMRKGTKAQRKAQPKRAPGSKRR